MNREELVSRFTYHPPDTKEKKAVHDAVNAVFSNISSVTSKPADVLSLGFTESNKLFLDAALALNEIVPDSADKSAAVRNLQLARNFVNLAISERSRFYVKRANEYLLLAKFESNAAVAIGAAKQTAEAKPEAKPETKYASKKKA
jgi:hypothetical protein